MSEGRMAWMMFALGWVLCLAVIAVAWGDGDAMNRVITVPWRVVLCLPVVGVALSVLRGGRQAS